MTNSSYPPKGILKFAFRLPVYLYRYRLGWLLGGRFLLINHVGRKSGLPREAVVEVVERVGDSVIVAAGYGAQTQWYQNLRARPEIVVQIGRKKQPVTAEFISPEDGEEIMVRYWNNNPKATGRLLSILGYHWDSTEVGLRQIANESLRFVRFLSRTE